MNSHDKNDLIRAMIVDDELFGRENLKKIIEMYCPELEVIACAGSVMAALEQAKKTRPDVVFLDINMPTLDGFDFIKNYDGPDFMIVIVSAHEEFGIKAVKAGVTDYLLKPINIKELKETVKKLMMIQKTRFKITNKIELNKIVIPDAHGFDIVEYDKIIRLEADGSYTKVFIKNEKVRTISRTLKDFENTLPRQIFCRIHKSHLINLNYICDYKNMNGYEITMSDGSKVELSRRKVPEFRRKIKATAHAV